jgi:hypothetical protein
MIRLLLLGIGAWAAWRYRHQIQELATRFPEMETRAAKAVGEVTGTIKEGLQDVSESMNASPSADERKASRRSK